MKGTDFVHLHVHTEYSLLDGAIRLRDLFETVKAYGMNAVAMTDHGNLHGALEFYEKATKSGIKPIIGCEVYVAPGSRFDRAPKDRNEKERNYHLILLAENYSGYRNLIKLVTAAHLEGFYYKPRIDKEMLKECHEGLIGMSACLKGEVAVNLANGNVEDARSAAEEYARIFGSDNFFLEIQANGIPEQEIVNKGLIQLARELGLPLVATNDCHYMRKEDSRAHDVLLCIQTGKAVQDQKRLRFSTEELYFKSPAEMEAEFSHVPEALSNTRVIADRCNVELTYGKHIFPYFPLEEGVSAEETFAEVARQGLEQRLEEIRKKEAAFDEEKEKEYRERLEEEIRVITEMGFATYFLIVADFVNYAKKEKIPVGPGRGSAAGSLVAYCMEITDIDPIKYELLFERFLNLERVSLPDIDVDFCINGRERVLQYVSKKYGKDHVAQITTFGTLQARAVIRDVGRALGMPYNEVDKIAKLVPTGKKVTLKEALKLEPSLQELAEKKQTVRELFDVAMALEGLPRHSSTHAAGVVIADKPLTEYVPLYRGNKGEVVTQFPMEYVEKVGLIKFDFLGLRNLTVIDNAVKLVRENHQPDFDIRKIPLDDPRTFELLKSGDTLGVFQLESSGMRDILVRLAPEDFTDIIALVALYRPGPLESGMVENFIQAKHGKIPVTFELEELRPILGPTYGIILYQEQVMKIANVLANYSLGEADILRRAMGKKKPEVMAAQRERFMKGAMENKIDPRKASHIFDLMEKFAGYGFNKSHSAAYALIAYQTAYLKANYPVEFMAALLNSVQGDTDNILKLINECRDHGIEILPPDVNASEDSFTVKGNRIRFGLAAVKNVGHGAVNAIISTRKAQGPFKSIYDFCERVPSNQVNRRVIENLVKCGAFDSIHPQRSRVYAALDDAIARGQELDKEQKNGQLSLFGFMGIESTADEELPEVADWDMKQRLAFEKEALGLYVSGHPMDSIEGEVSHICTVTTGTISEERDGAQVIICGLLTLIKEITTRKGERMGFINLEDRYGSIEVVAFPEVYEKILPRLGTDEPSVLVGHYQRDEKKGKIIASRVLSLDEAQSEAIKSLRLYLNGNRVEEKTLTRIKHTLQSSPGECPTLVHVLIPGHSETIIALNGELRVNPTGALLSELRKLLGNDKVRPELAVNGYDSRRNGL